MSAARVDLMEVMCGEHSELTKQTIVLGGKAMRFSKIDGDLSTGAGRRQLFQKLVVHRPRHLWYSPVCKPWCMRSQFNAMRSLAQNETIFQNRMENLWQISLGVVLFEFQQHNQSHYHHEQPKGSSMLKVPGSQTITEHTMPCGFDLCTVGQLKDPVSGMPIRKRLDVRTTSHQLHRSLHQRWCSGDHSHQQIEGRTMSQGQSMLRSEFTEHYPVKFARQVAKILLNDKSKWEVAMVETEEHPTKKRRLSSKMNATEIATRFPSNTWTTVMQVADRMARRVGTMVVDTGPLVQQVQSLCPEHHVKHVVLCRGTDRQVGPNKQIMKGEAPVRRRICIRRKHEDVHVEDEWEPWERLTFKGLRRKCVPARVSLTVFAQVRSKPVADGPVASIHERPPAETVPESKRARREANGPETFSEDCPNAESSTSSQDPSQPQSDQAPSISETSQPVTIHNQDVNGPITNNHNLQDSTSSDANNESRQVIDLASMKHGPKFLALSPEEQSWLLKIHGNMGHPGAQKLQRFCQQLGCPSTLLQAIPDLKCSTCLETSQPKLARPSAIHDPVDFGDVVSMDEIVWGNREGEQFRFYHFVDQSTMYHTAIAVPNKQGEEAAQALMQGWIQWAGPPKLLCIDAATELNSNFLQKYGICPRTCATEAHWQNSRVERHGGILQVMLNKMDHESTIKSYHELSIALAQATMTKNQWSRHRGFAPELLVFGRMSRMPGSVISDESRASHELALRDMPEGQRFREELAVRERARKAFAMVDNDQSMRRALTGQSRPHRGQYARGEWVMSRVLEHHPKRGDPPNVAVPEVPNPVEVPIPDDPDDELLADCFALTQDECWKIEINVSQHDIDQWRREEHPHQMAFIATAAKRQRSEVKLSQLNDQERKLFHDAKLKEINSWLSTETVARITRHQIPEGNLMRCRWILTWKPVDPSDIAQNPQKPKHTPKARLVVLGYEDPLVHEIPRDSPTMSKLTRMLILQTAASQGWDIESFDIRTAFLRGSEQSERVLGIEPPTEMREHMRLKRQEVLKLLKGAYGRVDAPYLWFMELKAGLEQLGFIPSPFDPCAFILPNPVTQATEGILGVHVDDGLCCGSKYFAQKLEELAQRFPFGSPINLAYPAARGIRKASGLGGEKGRNSSAQPAQVALQARYNNTWSDDVPEVRTTSPLNLAESSAPTITFLFMAYDAWQISLTFLYDGLPHMAIWEKFFRGGKPGKDFRVLIHCKSASKCRHDFRNHPIFNLVETVETEYCFGLVSAMNHLLGEALASGPGHRNDKFVFVSDTTLPVKPFKTIQRQTRLTSASFLCTG
eukprot:s1136_g25.t1